MVNGLNGEWLLVNGEGIESFDKLRAGTEDAEDSKSFRHGFCQKTADKSRQIHCITLHVSFYFSMHFYLILVIWASLTSPAYRSDPCNSSYKNTCPHVEFDTNILLSMFAKRI